MAVGFDAVMTGGNSSDGDCQQGDNVTSLSSTGITVGASATLLVVVILWQDASPTGISVTWDGVAMTLGPTVTSFNEKVPIYTLVNPASGAKTLSASWTNTSDCYMSAVSFSGTDTVTGIKTADSTTAIETTSIAVTTDSAGATVAVFCVDGAEPTLNQTKIFDNAPLDPGGGASYALGGSGTNSHTFTGAGGNHQALAGVHVIAPAPAGFVPYTLTPQLGPILAQ